tara:strand:+ start:23467 stop:23673 length:207 start_codon:yes stop_codon:yes gene_type:complete
MEVLPPFAVYKSDKVNQEGLEGKVAHNVYVRPTPLRSRNAKYYNIPQMILKGYLEAPNARGFAIHLKY